LDQYRLVTQSAIDFHRRLDVPPHLLCKALRFQAIGEPHLGNSFVDQSEGASVESFQGLLEFLVALFSHSFCDRLNGIAPF
jgi:hypothetical protein